MPLHYQPDFQATFARLAREQWLHDSTATKNTRSIPESLRDGLVFMADMGGVLLLTAEGDFVAALHDGGLDEHVRPSVRATSLRVAARHMYPELVALLPAVPADARCSACNGTGAGPQFGRYCDVCDGQGHQGAAPTDAQEVPCPVCEDWSDEEDAAYREQVAAMLAIVRGGPGGDVRDARERCFCRGRRTLPDAWYPPGLRRG
ncbi:MAG: hypothetical protein RIT81_16525 [Deltaproteobacteria bacterium]